MIIRSSAALCPNAFCVLFHNARRSSTRPVSAFIDYACDRKITAHPSIEELQYTAAERVRSGAASRFRRARALLLKGDSYAGGERTAVDLLELAAQDGIPEAAHDLGLLLYKGDGIVADQAKAAKLFEFAAEEGIGKAAHNLGFMLYCGHGVEQNKVRAAELFEVAAGRGVAKAATTLALMLARGDGVAQDLARAQHFREAAKVSIAAKKSKQARKST